MNFDDNLNACAALVEKADPDRFAAAMAAPVAARAVLFPLYALNVEVSRAPWVTQEPMIAEMRLQWWRDALEEIAEARPVRRHEVVTPLARVLPKELAPVLDRLVAARRWDIYKDAFEDEAHFHSYISETAGGLMWAAACALGEDTSSQVENEVRAVGYAAGLARFLQAVPELEAQKRVPLVDGRREAIAALANDALRNLPQVSRTKKRMARAARSALTEAFMANSILKQAAAEPGRVAQGALGISRLKRSVLLWRWS